MEPDVPAMRMSRVAFRHHFIQDFALRPVSHSVSFLSAFAPFLYPCNPSRLAEVQVLRANRLRSDRLSPGGMDRLAGRLPYWEYEGLSNVVAELMSSKKCKVSGLCRILLSLGP